MALSDISEIVLIDVVAHELANTVTCPNTLIEQSRQMLYIMVYNIDLVTNTACTF